MAADSASAFYEAGRHAGGGSYGNFIIVVQLGDGFRLGEGTVTAVTTHQTLVGAGGCHILEPIQEAVTGSRNHIIPMDITER